MTQHNYALDFIHIGLGKCASTTLQNLWLTSKNYALSNALELSKTVDKLLLESSAPPRINFEISRKGNEHTVLSSEGLTWGFLNAPEQQYLIANKQKMIADILIQSACSRHIFILVRNPLEWIRSAHAQSINEGNFLSLSKFVAQQKTFIRAVLNMDFLLSCWQQGDMEISVLPVELLNDSAEDFWACYEDQLAVSRPDAYQRKIKSNVTDRGRLYPHACLNRLLWTMQKELSDSPEYSEHFSQEKATVCGSLDYVRKWATRRYTNYCDFGQLEKMVPSDSDESVSDFLHFNLDEEWSSFIQNNFLYPLKKYLPDCYWQQYNKSCVLPEKEKAESY